tara:strand:+ start:38006 stop:38746 length:741 start_codon:yes stop_codon:yes gene_type:complete
VKIIPAVDLKNGECVRLYKGDYSKATLYSTDPVSVARQFSALDVADLHIVDLDGARSGRQANYDAVAAIASQCDLNVQVGGGIRSRDDVAAWLDNGVTRCVVGSVAISKPHIVREWIAEFGPESIVLALDVNTNDVEVPMLMSQGWTQESGVSLWECLNAYYPFNKHHVLCTDIDRDGAMAGPNLALYSEILRRYPGLQLQASGGVRDVQDLQELRTLGVPAAISGRALLDGAISASEVSTFRQSA